MMKNFDKDFVSRTLEILDRHYGNEEYEVTLLLNCLLALVSLPIERNKIKKGIQDDCIIEQFRVQCINRLKQLINDKDYINTEEKFFFNNIRNAIAHLHIEVEKGNYNNTIENVILRNAKNEEKYKRREYNFQINISVKNLREFAKFVAQEYLEKFFQLDK